MLLGLMSLLVYLNFVMILGAGSVCFVVFDLSFVILLLISVLDVLLISFKIDWLFVLWF